MTDSRLFWRLGIYLIIVHDVVKNYYFAITTAYFARSLARSLFFFFFPYYTLS
jgi:hypothetical protein